MSFVKYNSSLTPFAKRLRANMTLAEVLLWKRLNKKQLGVRFQRQRPAGIYILDFYCKELQLAIEVDGDSHNLKLKQDLERQRQLEALEIRFLRFWDYEVKNDLNSVIERIETWITENPPRRSGTPPKEGSTGRTVEKKSPPLEGGAKAGVGSSRRGAALVVVLWVLMIVAMIVSTFAFEMHLEAKMISAQRKRFKADQLALAGVELAKVMLLFEEESDAEDIIYEEDYLNKSAQLAQGVPVQYSEEFGDGTVTLDFDFEESRRNVKTMSDDEWKLLFDQAGVPNTRWDAMLDCLEDWQDENDLHQLNGAESDDPFYRDRGYECKNAPVDTVDELLLIKNWGEDVLYGTEADPESGEPISGLAGYLTTWGEGKINPTSAGAEVLYSTTLPEDVINAILELRLGIDGEAGTDDDGLTQADVDSMGLDPDTFTLTPEYVAVTSIGKVGDLESRISCIFKLGEEEPSPLFWTEGKLAE